MTRSPVDFAEHAFEVEEGGVAGVWEGRKIAGTVL